MSSSSSRNHARKPGAIRSVLIAGGGTAGWMAAAFLAARLQGTGVAITVLESSAIATVGVGEATVPAIRDFFRAIGLHDFDVLRACQGTPKLGIDFLDWAGDGTRFFHPFGLYGLPSRNVPFHQYWLKLAHAGDRRPIGDYSLCTRMAHDGTFMLPVDNPVNDLAVFNWAVHFDAARFAAMLRDHALAQGVTRIDDIITHVGRDGLSGHIDRIETQGGLALTADLFLDCTGFRSLLLGQALGVERVDWTDMLPCDRAVAMPCANGGLSTGPIPPAPRARRDGNGAFPCKTGWAMVMSMPRRISAMTRPSPRFTPIWKARRWPSPTSSALARGTGALSGRAIASASALRRASSNRWNRPPSR